MLSALCVFECIVLTFISMAMLITYSRVIRDYDNVYSVGRFGSIGMSFNGVVILLALSLFTVYLLISCNLVGVSFKVNVIYLFVIVGILLRMVNLQFNILLDRDFRFNIYSIGVPVNIPIAIGVLGLGFAIFSHGLTINVSNNSGDVPVLEIAVIFIILAIVILNFMPKERADIEKIKYSLKFKYVKINSEVVYMFCILSIAVCSVLWLIMRK